MLTGQQQLHLGRGPWLIAAGLFLATLLVYTLTLAPSVVSVFDDSLEFQLVTYQLGIAHPTGYPLYTLLGKLFTLLPVGNVAYRVNWMSAVFGAATVGIVYLNILPEGQPRQRETRFSQTGHTWPVHAGAATGALIFAVGQVFWQQSTVAEVYTLNAFFVALILAVATYSPRLRPTGLYLIAFLVGLSLTHHRTMILLLPALGLYLMITGHLRLLRNPRVLLLVGLCGFFPLLLYFYLPLRGHIGSLDGTYENSWSGFWRQVSAAGYGTFIFDNPFGQERNLSFYWNLLADQFYTTVLGLIGLAFLAGYGQLKYLVLTATAFVSYSIFNVFYNVSDIAVFFIPVFLVWAIWSGLGAAFLLGTASSFKRRQWRYLAIGLLLVVYLTMFGQLFRTNWLDIRQRYSWRVHDYGIDVLRQPIQEASAIVGILGEMTLLRYFQQTEGLRADIATIAADQEAERLAVVEQLLLEEHPVYLTRELAGAPERWSLAAEGPLIRVQSQPVRTLPEKVISTTYQVTPEITLHGYDYSRVGHTGEGPAPVRIALVWQVTAPIETDLKVSVRLLTPAGEVLAASDAIPVHFAYPTSAWRSGEFITDVYDLSLPAEYSADTVTPLVIWYEPDQNSTEIGRIELPPLNL